MKFILSIFLIHHLLVFYYCDRDSLSASDLSGSDLSEKKGKVNFLELDGTDNIDAGFKNTPTFLKSKTINYKGYSMDMSIDTFKSMVSIGIEHFLII